MTIDQLRAYCEAEIARLEAEVVHHERQAALHHQHADFRRGGIQAYKDILDEFPPSEPATPEPTPDRPDTNPGAVEPVPDEHPLDSAGDAQN